MKQNKAEQPDIKYPATKSLVDSKGNPLLWTIRHISSAQVDKLKKKFTFEEPVPGKYGQTKEVFKQEEYLLALMCECISDPDLRDAELQDSYGVTTPGDLLYAMMDNYGEFLELQNVISEALGLNEDLDSKSKEAKNS
jgi:hypothetical protein